MILIARTQFIIRWRTTSNFHLGDCWGSILIVLFDSVSYFISQPPTGVLKIKPERRNKHKSQVEKGSPVRFYSQQVAYNDSAGPKKKKRGRQVDLTPTSTLPGSRSRQNSQRSFPVLLTAENDHRPTDPSPSSQSMSTAPKPVSPSLENVEYLLAGSNTPHEPGRSWIFSP